MSYHTRLIEEAVIKAGLDVMPLRQMMSGLFGRDAVDKEIQNGERKDSSQEETPR
ncbi:hypothetical protein ACQKDS_05295 [Serratia sp. NPDC078593]|uniref:hypothetical protein n=1 Tax=unclassified Serratia (in: enterobacteria) TaxID=2647522 RepID=UPI0037CFD83D